MASFKAIRFGPVRVQYCPVGDHVTAVRLVRDEDLTPAERLAASRKASAIWAGVASSRDAPLPELSPQGRPAGPDLASPVA
jgi:hypothetical protein